MCNKEQAKCLLLVFPYVPAMNRVLFGGLCGLSLLVGGNALLGAGYNDAAQCEESQCVGNDHQIVEGVGQLPNQIVGDHGAQEDEYQCDNGVYNGADLGILLAEEILNIDLTEKIPAQHGRESEEEEADGDEDSTEAFAEDNAKGGLGEVGLIDDIGNGTGVAICKRTVGGIEGGDDDKCVESENNKAVDENAHHGNNALLVGVLYVGLCVGMGGGAHTGFIGEEAALCALRNGLLEGCADSAADDGLRHKRILEDHTEGGGEVGNACGEDDNTAHEEESCHNGNDLLGNGSKTLNAAEEDYCANNNQHKTHNPGGDAKCGFHGRTYGIGLYHAAEEAEGKDNGNGKEACEELSEAALEGAGDVVNGTALYIAVFIYGTGLDGQSGLGIDGGHSQEGNYPHPEDGAGTAHKNSAGGTDYIAGTDLGGDGGGKGLEGAHTGFLLTAAEGEIAEYAAHTFAEAAHLHKTGLDGVEKTHCNKKNDQNVAGQIGIDVANDGIEGCLYVCEKVQHYDFPLFFVLSF